MESPNFEPAIQRAARQLSRTTKQIDERAYDRDDYLQDLRVKAWLAQQSLKDGVTNPKAYVNRAVFNTGISLARRRRSHAKHMGPWEVRFEETRDPMCRARMQEARSAMAELTQHLADDEADLIQSLLVGERPENVSRTTFYRRARKAIDRARLALTDFTFGAEIMHRLESALPPLQDVRPPRIIAQTKPHSLVLQTKATTEACACFSQSVTLSRTKSGDRIAACGTITSWDGFTIPGLPAGRPSLSRQQRKRKHRRAFQMRGEHDQHVFGLIGSIQAIIETAARRAPPPSSGGDGPDGGNSGNGPGDKPPACIACGGSGRASNGRTCSPCKGTGTQRAAEAGLPEYQHNVGDARQSDLFAKKAANGEGVGGAHVPAPVAKGKKKGPKNSRARGGDDPAAGVAEGRVEPTGDARSEVRSGVLPVQGEPPRDPVQRDPGSHGGSGVSGTAQGGQAPTGSQVAPHEQLVRGEVLAAVSPEQGFAIGIPTTQEKAIDAYMRPTNEVVTQPAVSASTVKLSPEPEPVMKSASTVAGSSPGSSPPSESKSQAGESKHQPGGYIVNLTNLTFIKADWGAHVPLVRTSNGYAVYQVDYWAPYRNAWVSVVATHTGRPPQNGCVEVTVDEWLKFDRQHFPWLDIRGWQDFDTKIVATESNKLIHQLSWWSPASQLGIIVVKQPTNRPPPSQGIEFTLDEFFWFLREKANQVSDAEAIAKIRESIEATKRGVST